MHKGRNGDVLYFDPGQICPGLSANPKVFHGICSTLFRVIGDQRIINMSIEDISL